MIRGVKLLLASLLTAVIWMTPAFADTRVALVIGNGAYKSGGTVSELKNPPNDSEDMTSALRQIGFDVDHHRDLDYTSMRRALRDFSIKAARADIALIFFAGHGIEIDGQNYLLPVDAQLKRDNDVDFEAISLDLALRAVDGAGKLKVVLLDACRNNPFLAQMKKSSSKRSIGRGLARVEPSVGTLVGFAAKEGTTADDGDGRNSPFTSALLNHLREPGLEINFLFRKVRDTVLQETNGGQEPFTYGSLPGDRLYLVPPKAPEPAEVVKETPAPTEQTVPTIPSIPVSPVREVAEVWAATKDTNSEAVLKAFIARYPDTFYATLAKARLEEVQAKKVARLQPPPPARKVDDTPEKTVPPVTTPTPPVQVNIPPVKEETAPESQDTTPPRRTTLPPATDGPAEKDTPAQEDYPAGMFIADPSQIPSEVTYRSAKYADDTPDTSVAPSTNDDANAYEAPRVTAVRPDVSTEPMSVRRAQELLYNLNYDVGAIDGIMGNTTSQALRRYQRYAGLPQTGELDREVFERLLSERVPDTWGALSTALDGTWGSSWNYPSRSEAEQRSIEECKKNTSLKCTPLTFHSSNCAASYKWETSTRHGWRANAESTIEEAKRAALASCREYREENAPCVFLTALCADGSHENN